MILSLFCDRLSGELSLERENRQSLVEAEARRRASWLFPGSSLGTIQEDTPDARADLKPADSRKP